MELRECRQCVVLSTKDIEAFDKSNHLPTFPDVAFDFKHPRIFPEGPENQLARGSCPTLCLPCSGSGFASGD